MYLYNADTALLHCTLIFNLQDQLDSIIPMQPHPQMEAMLSQKKGAQLQTLAYVLRLYGSTRNIRVYNVMQLSSPMPPGGEQLASSRGGRTLQSGLPATQPLDMYTQQQLQLQQLMAAQQQRFGTQLMAGTVGPPHTAMASAAFFGLGGPMQLPPSTLPLSTFPKHGVIPLERPGGVSRSTYARLYSAGFPLILDRNGNHADLAADDPNFALDVRREDLDPLQINELVLQFLAFSQYANEYIRVHTELQLLQECSRNRDSQRYEFRTTLFNCDVQLRGAGGEQSAERRAGGGQASRVAVLHVPDVPLPAMHDGAAGAARAGGARCGGGAARLLAAIRAAARARHRRRKEHLVRATHEARTRSRLYAALRARPALHETRYTER